MSVKVQVVTTDGQVHDIRGGYGDMDDACGDTRGDLYTNILQQLGSVSIAELRFLTNRPIELKQTDEGLDIGFQKGDLVTDGNQTGAVYDVYSNGDVVCEFHNGMKISTFSRNPEQLKRVSLKDFEAFIKRSGYTSFRPYLYSAHARQKQ